MKPYYVSVLDGATLADIFGLESLKLNIVDFEIWGNGDILILD